MQIRETILGNRFVLGSLALSSFFILPSKLVVPAIVIWLLVCFYEGYVHKEISLKANLPWFVLFSSLFILYIISFFISNSSLDAFHSIERKASLIIFPIGFFFRRKNVTKKELDQILFIFQTACFLLAFYLTISLLWVLPNNLHQLNSEVFNYVLRTFVENKTGIHPTYISVIFLFSIFLQIKKKIKFPKQIQKISKVVLPLHFVMVISFCLMLAAKGPIISFFIAYAGVELVKNWKKGIFITLVAAIVLIVTILITPFLGNRFEELFKSSYVTSDPTSLTSSNIRKSINYCTWELVKENWLMGIGLKNIDTRLNQCYLKFENKNLTETNYNTHNQYYDIILALGIIGLLAFITIIFYPFIYKSAFSFDTYLFFKIFLIFCFLTENLIARQQGIVFFCYFNTLFVSYFFGEKIIKRVKLGVDKA
jgi:hypothetical protein